MHPASPFIIAAIVATIIGSYVVVWWRRTSFVVATAAANFIIFILYFAPGYLLPDSGIYEDVVGFLGFRSQTIFDGGQLWGLLTHMYIHAGVLHLAFNMIVLFLMGLPFEDRIGRRNVAIVYLVSGMLGGAVLNAFVELSFGATIGIGASGAISGLIGAFAVMYPRDRIPMVLVLIIVDRVPVALGALVFLGVETVLMFTGFNMAPGTGGNVSHTAHISALAVGVVIGFVMLKLGVEAPTYASRAKGRMGRLDLESLRALARGPSLAERFEAMAKEDIPEVQEALLQDFVARARCPRCDSIMELKGASVRCAKCDFKMDLKPGKVPQKGDGK